MVECHNCGNNEGALRIRIRTIYPPYHAGVIWCYTCFNQLDQNKEVV